MYNWNNADRTLKTLGNMIKNKLKAVTDTEYLKYRQFFDELIKDENKRRGL
jgi:hypothetical protein